MAEDSPLSTLDPAEQALALEGQYLEVLKAYRGRTRCSLRSARVQVDAFLLQSGREVPKGDLSPTLFSPTHEPLRDDREQSIQDLARLIGWQYLERCTRCDRYKLRNEGCWWCQGIEPSFLDRLGTRAKAKETP
jgi:hypothetical protein